MRQRSKMRASAGKGRDMAAPMVGSALLRRYIGRQFARLRSQAGLSQEAAADALQRSRATIARIEEGDPRVRFRDIEVRAMLDLYHASERDRATLLGLTAETRNGHRKGWWHDYTDTALPGWFELSVALEDSAEIIREYDIENVPGLLQTRAYAEQVMRSPANNLAPDEAAHRVQLRMQRQSLLTRPRAPRYEVILSEAALHRPVGGPAAMAEQLQRLIDVGSMPNVSIRVVPFSVGAHGGMTAASAFRLLEFPKDPHGYGEPLEPPLVYVDSFTGALYLNKPDEVEAYRLAWDDLERRALDESATTDLINEMRKGFGSA